MGASFRLHHTMSLGMLLSSCVFSRLFNHSIVRQPVPAFTANALVKGGEFKKISSEDMKGKYSVLFFYPLDLYVIIMMHAPLL